jgi:hypothetical protein
MNPNIPDPKDENDFPTFHVFHVLWISFPLHRLQGKAEDAARIFPNIQMKMSLNRFDFCGMNESIFIRLL